jgi:hypothetical protein
MTDPPQPDDDRVARLEQQLADATAQVAQVQAALRSVAGGGLFGPSFAGSAPPAPTTVDRLAEPPRRVPFAFKMAVFSWSWWEQFGILMGITAPIALWGFVPVAIPAGFIAALATIGFLRGRRNVRRLALLKWGKVATVDRSSELSRGTYYSGVTYSNMKIPQATGWDVTRDWYSGPASTTEVSYTVDGARGVLKLRGLPYAGGVILADPRKPSVALCVSSFPYSVKPDVNGELVGRLRARMWVGIVATIVIEAALVLGAVFSATQLW